jgi:predicted HicB family RNase H-like nuclease
MKKQGKKKGQKTVRTTIVLPKEIHQALRIEAIKKGISMSELILQKLEELEKYKQRFGGIASAEDFL